MSPADPIEIVGLISPYRGSEVSPQAPVYDPAFVPEIARAYEQAGYDRVLIGQNARSADSLVTASWVAAATTRLKLMIAHRPGFIAPTMAARALATLDQLSGGRAGVHIITAFNDVETQCDGDYLTKDQRYHRSREYVEVLRKMWSSSEPFDHEGDFYRCNAAFSEVHPVHGTIPVFWAGTSELGLRYGAEMADVYAMAPGSVAQVAQLVGKLRAQAAPLGAIRAFPCPCGWWWPTATRPPGTAPRNCCARWKKSRPGLVCWAATLAQRRRRRWIMLRRPMVWPMIRNSGPD